MGRTACTEPQYLYSRAIPLLPLWAVQPVQSLSVCTVELYLYSPYGPYGLYRASVPVQGSTLPYLAISMDVRPGLGQIPTHKFKQTNTILANWQLHFASTSLIVCASLVIHYEVCLATGPRTLQKPLLQKRRSKCFLFQIPVSVIFLKVMQLTGESFYNKELV